MLNGSRIKKYLRNDTFNCHVLYNAGDWSGLDRVDFIESQPENTIRSPIDEGVRDTLGAFDGLAFNRNAPNSNIFLRTNQHTKEKCQYSIDNSRSEKSITKGYSKGIAVLELGSGRLGGIIHIMMCLKRLWQQTGKNYSQSSLPKNMPQRSELPVSKFKLRVTAVEPDPNVTGQTYSVSVWRSSVGTSPISLPFSL
jgi:hypothetical protein